MTDTDKASPEFGTLPGGKYPVEEHLRAGIEALTDEQRQAAGYADPEPTDPTPTEPEPTEPPQQFTGSTWPGVRN